MHGTNLRRVRAQADTVFRANARYVAAVAAGQVVDYGMYVDRGNRPER